MKRVGYLYQTMMNKNLIEKSIRKALINKTKQPEVIKVLDNIDHYINYYYNLLKVGNYQFKKGNIKTILSGSKERKIQIPTLRDHIMQHIMMSVLKPIIKKGMYEWNSGVIPKRGPLYAKKYIEKVTRIHNPKYVLKIDIKKYFHNINTSILLKQLERKIKDKKYLGMMSNLLNTANSNSGKGIPIGFYTSQWLSNFYLQPLDYYVKQNLKVKWYVRYMDDLILMGNNKRELCRIKMKIFKYMKEELDIEPNNKYQVFPRNKRHIDYVGYIFKKDRTYLRKKTFKIYKRRLNSLNDGIFNIFLCRSYMSIRGWLIHCSGGKKFLNVNECPNLVIKIKKYISKKDKEKNYERLCKSF